MISKRLQLLFLISIPIFVLHGLEEYFFRFYEVDPMFLSVFGYFDSMPVLQATFLLFQLMLWLALFFVYLTVSSEKGRLAAMTVVGLILIFEAHHFIEALVRQTYYPGLATAVLFIPVAFYFWKELVAAWRYAR